MAVALIAEIEGMDRGRYAGPVGWMDADGDGEWGIALRSAEYDGNRVRLFAGCGIVADSDPEAELAEAAAKFVPVRDALTPSPHQASDIRARCDAQRDQGVPRVGCMSRAPRGGALGHPLHAGRPNRGR